MESLSIRLRKGASCVGGKLERGRESENIKR
jgi:hypothetical protein